jgi:hypothetical protein
MSHSTLGDFLIDIHFTSYMQRKEQLLAALQAFREDWTITPQVLHVTDSLQVQQFWFARRSSM